MLKHLCAQGLRAAACRGPVVRLAYSLSECSHLTKPPALSQRVHSRQGHHHAQTSPPHTHTHRWWLPWARFTKSQGFCGIGTGGSWNFLHTSPNVYLWTLCFSSLKWFFNRFFCIKNGQGSGVGRGKGAHILLRGIYAVPFIHRNTNTNRAFFKAFRCWLGWDI